MSLNFRYSNQELEQKTQTAAKNIISMVELAACGHPGGSLSSLHGLLAVLNTMKFDVNKPNWSERDRLVVSHGHISPGTYAALAEFGFVNMEKVFVDFRTVGSHFGGHVESTVPGIEWNTGNLGQGLSASCGFALAARVQKRESRVYCIMGDGEQQKGQISEARRFARKFDLGNLTALVDVNRLQIGGACGMIMPQNIKAGFESDGWETLEIDGHDYKAINDALIHAASSPTTPVCILLNTVMGKGFPCIENDHKYHGQALGADLFNQALAEEPAPGNLEEIRELRRNIEDEVKPLESFRFPSREPEHPGEIAMGQRRIYPADKKIDCRSAYGNAVLDLGEANPEKLVAFSCDLEGSVKLNAFHKRFPDRFFEAGIQEHHTATLAGSIARDGLVSFWSTFGAFAGCEAYNQQRLNDQNQANVKVCATHCGMDVGEDGPTHQQIDYIGLFNGIFGFRVFLPADANQTDAMIRKAAAVHGPVFVGMGRSKFLPLTKENGEVFYDEDYHFEEGKLDLLRKGKQGLVVTCGAATNFALRAVDKLKEDGVDITLLNAGSIKPFDHAGLREHALEKDFLITVEDHNIHTGLGQICAASLFDSGVALPHLRLGVHSYSSSGKPNLLYREQGMDDDGIILAVKNMMETKDAKSWRR